ncbi:MAG TPA: NAD-dependent succinate-semialdehyde dehydrogenase [Trebonia sp.]|nr:NAD-dependent succinate-semialdehyde dehydrogenase [Trebonia sp.]
MTQTPPYQVTDPATGEVTEKFPFATDAEVEQALAAATGAYDEWRKRPLAERVAIVKRVAELFTERAADLAALITKEMGKRPAAAVDEAEFCTDIFGYYADNGPALIADKPVPGHDNARIEYRPVGPVLGVMPWNYPYYQVARFAAPALVVGNTVIVKHAENCPTSALAIAQIMKDAGVPEGVYNNIFATHEQVATMIADPRLRGVSLTGSERAGTVVAAQAGRNLKKVVLELGGSDPYVILDTPDVESAAEVAWTTRMENVGQACNSNKRMIVMNDVYDDFVAALVKRAAAMTPRPAGDDSDEAYSPMVSRKAAENLLAQVQDAVSKGATLHVGGTLGDGNGAYFAPAVLTGVTPDMRAYKEELFGLVAVVYKVSSDDEAVNLANVVDFGLGGAVWSTDEARATRVAEQLEVGMANVNTPAGEGADLPFGGTKRSGFGRELGPLGIDEFVNKRLFYVEK